MKTGIKFSFAATIFALFTTALFAHTARVENRTSQDVHASALCNTNTKKFVFRSNATATYTLHGTSDSDCEVTMNGKTYTVPNGARIVIKTNGTIEIK